MDSRFKALYLTVLLSAALAAESCSSHLGNVGEKMYSFLPGECLKSSEIKKNVFSPSDYVRAVKEGIQLYLSLDVDANYEEVDYPVCRFTPTASVYKSFGDDADYVKNTYEKEYDKIRRQIKRSYDYITVYYSGEFSLTADKTFAGHAPSEDLSDLAYLHNGSKHISLSSSFALEEMESLSRGFSLIIPAGDFEVVDDTVTLTLSIPVKVGLYLTWLHDSLSNPDAQMQFRDEVLEGSFRIKKGLH